MNLTSNLTTTLKNLQGLQAPPTQTEVFSAESPTCGDVELSVEFTNVDRLSCAVRELQLRVPAYVGADVGHLETWAKNLCSRLSYLLEDLGPLELDSESGQVLVRSTTPDRQEGSRSYYEAVLESHTAGSFTLKRYRYEAGASSREWVDLQFTHEVLGKLATDLIDTLPSV